MEECSFVSTSMAIGCKLINTNESPEVEQTLYRSTISSLPYFTTSRPKIMQLVGIFGIFQETPKHNHLLAAKRILKLLRATMEYGLWYPRGKYFSLTIYIDVDLVGDVDDQTRTSGGDLFLYEYLVSWLRKKKASISLSTTKEKYIQQLLVALTSYG